MRASPGAPRWQGGTGRGMARAQAALLKGENLPPVGRLMRAAARASLDEQPLPAGVIPPGLDPLWPALARHLCRGSTAEDRALLTSLAQDPTLRPPPLQWGLRYIVRGDILLDGGTEITIDELTDRAGVPRLPYLEDLPPEIQIPDDAFTGPPPPRGWQ